MGYFLVVAFSSLEILVAWNRPLMFEVLLLHLILVDVLSKGRASHIECEEQWHTLRQWEIDGVE